MKLQNILLTLVFVAASVGECVAQLQNAGALLVDLDGASFMTGDPTWANSGSLGNFQTNGDPQAVAFGSGAAVFLDGAGDYFQQLNLAGNALENAPASITGGGARSVEFMVYNPFIADEETVVSWGNRGNLNRNFSVNYGDNPTFGALGGWGGDADMGWGGGGNPDANTPSANSWHHIVLTYDDGSGPDNAGDKRLFVDGALLHSELGIPILNTDDFNPILIGAQYDDDPVSGINPTLQGNLGIGRLRIHDGVLTASQVANNYDQLAPMFVDPPPPSPGPLSQLPVHRYSFNEIGGAGTTLVDSISSADGTIVDVGMNDASVGGGSLSMAGGARTDSDFADFPDGIVTTTAAAGTPGDLTVEVWGTPQSAQNWSRVFSFGSSTNDVMHMSWSRGTTQSQNEFRFRDNDPGPEVNFTTQDFGANVLGQESHWIVVFDDDGGVGGITRVSIYFNGALVSEGDTTLDVSDVNDVDVWLGRSQWNDNTANADYEEFRLYSHALTFEEVLGNNAAGPDVVNVPEPQAIGLIGLVGIAMLFRRRSRR